MGNSIRIFISSPGDVAAERQRSAIVVQRLRKEFARFFDVAAVLWEYEPMLASGHFQDVIEPPSKTDIVVMILWSRLGTALPPDRYQGMDGRTPVTGTEWEFEDALKSKRERGSPDLLVYRKAAAAVASFTAEAQLRAAGAQWTALEGFWARHFVDPDGSFKAGFHTFADLDAFEHLLEDHLRSLLRQRLPAHAVADRASAITWHQGSPFRGLQAFEPEHAEIFFGRAQAEREVTEALLRRADQGPSFLLVLGASGSGKSSLVKAGVLSHLRAPGVLSQVAELRHVIVRPGERPEDPIGMLAQSLLRTGLPELAALGISDVDLAQQWRSAPQDAALHIRPGQKRAAEGQAGAVALAVIVDQFEELFTLPQVDGATRDLFIAILAGLARETSDPSRAWVIATMRSDLYHHTAQNPLLAKLAQGPGQYHLAPMRAAELEQTIRQPAEVAGLDFELDEHSGLSLDGILLDAAAKDTAALPLLEFALEELYRRDVESGNGKVLTLASYRAIGELEGAIAARAEEVCRGFAGSQAIALPSVLRALVTVDEAGHRSAHSVPRSELQGDSDRDAVIDGLIGARLVVASGDEAGVKLRLTHEALLSRWPRLVALIDADIEFLRIRTRLRADRAAWAAAQENDDLLIPPGKRLAEAEDLLARRRGELDPDTIAYAERSVARDRALRTRSLRRARQIAAAMAILAAGAVGIGVFAWDRSVTAERAEATANVERANAEASLRELQVQQSSVLAVFAGDLLEQGDAETAFDLAARAASIGMAAQDDGVPSAIDAARGALMTQAPVGFAPGKPEVLAISTDGSKLIVGDNGVDIWSAFPMRHLGNVLPDRGGAHRLFSLAVSPKQDVALVGGVDGRAVLFDYRTLPAVTHELEPSIENAPVGAFYTHFSSNGEYAIVAPARSGISVWNAATGDFVSTFNPFPDLEDYPTAAARNDLERYRRLLISTGPDGSSLLTGGMDGIVRCWNLATGQMRYSFQARDSWIFSVTTNEAGTMAIVVQDGSMASVWRLYDDRAELIDTIGGVDLDNVPSWSPDGRHFVLQGRDDAANQRLYEIETTGSGDTETSTVSLLKTIKTGEISDDANNRYNGGRQRAFLDDGSAIVAVDSSLTRLNVWDIATGTLVDSYGFRGDKFAPAVWTRDLKTVALATSRGIVTWQSLPLAGRMKRIHEDAGIKGIGYGDKLILSWVGDAQSGVAGHAFNLWDPAQPEKPLWSLPTEGIQLIADLDEKHNAVLVRGAGVVLAADIDTQQIRAQAATGYSSDGAQLLDGDRLMVVSRDRKAHLLNWEGYDIAAPLEGTRNYYDFASSDDEQAFAFITEEEDVAVWFPADDRRVTVKVAWSNLTNKQFVDGAKFLVVTGGYGQVHLFETTEGKLVRAYYGLTGSVESVDASADGKFIAASSATGDVSIWLRESGEIRRTFSSTDKVPTSVEFSSDNRLLYVSNDRSLRAYSLATGVLVWRRDHVGHYAMPEPNLLRSITTAGQDLLIVDYPMMQGLAQDKSGVSVLDLSPAQVAALAGAAILEELTPSERLRFGISSEDDVPHEQATECDRLTAHPRDPGRVAPGISFDSIDAVAAVAACEAASKAQPSEGRLQYGLGRALNAAQRDQEAIAAFQRAIDSGYPMAWVGLGAIYDDADSPAHDAAASKEAFAKGAQAGVPAAMYFAGLNLWDGGVATDRSEAVRLWELAGDCVAEQKLGEIYAQGDGPIQRDDEKSLYHFVRAAALWPPKASDRAEIIGQRGSAARAYAIQVGLRQAADVVIKAIGSLPPRQP